MHRAVFTALTTGSLLVASGAQAWDLSFDLGLAGISFEEDEIDVTSPTAQAFGGEVIAEFDSGTFTHSLSFLGESYTGDFSDSDDHTLWLAQIAYALTTPNFFTYAGYGVSEDTGDSDTLAPYAFGGVGFETTGENGTTLTLQVGVLGGDDEFGETIQHAAFLDYEMAFAMSDDLSLRIGAAAVQGERWNAPDPSDGTVHIGELRLGLDYTPGEGPWTYWAEASRADFATTEESDSPFVDELRLGLSYSLGGGPTRAPLPNVGRWISVSVNEIE